MPSLSISKSLLIPVMQTPGYFWQHCLRGNQLHSWTGFSVQLATLEIWDITNIPVIITATGLYYASLLCCLRPRSSVLRSACTSIWSHLSPISKTSSIHIQRISAYIGIPGNSLADLEAKRGSTLPQTSVPVDLATAKALIRRVGQEEFHTCYTRDPHSATHSTLTAETNPLAHWRLGWTRSQCITVAQLRTGHCPLLAIYLHRIGWQQYPVCPYCRGDNETAQHLLHCCPSHTQARSSTFDQLHQLNWSSMHVVLSGVDRGRDTWHGMRERQRDHTVNKKMVKKIKVRFCDIMWHYTKVKVTKFFCITCNVSYMILQYWKMVFKRNTDEDMPISRLLMQASESMMCCCWPVSSIQQ